MIEDNLTNLQRIALEGEIAHALSTLAHDADIKFRIYYLLKEVSEDFRNVLVHIFKEAVTFDETVVDRLYLESQTNEVPTWLWIEKAIADIKLNLKTSELTFTDSKLSISKITERKKLIKSAFIRFGRVALLVSPASAIELFDEILKDEQLSFLHISCFYLKNTYNDSIEKGFIKGTQLNAKILNVEFSLNDLLSSEIETDSLEKIAEEKVDKEKGTFVTEITDTPVKKETILIEGFITPTELSDFISKKVIELFQNSANTSKTVSSNSKIKYVVQKVYTDSGLKTDIRSCATEEEAIEFINKVKSEVELPETCKLIIKIVK